MQSSSLANMMRKLILFISIAFCVSACFHYDWDRDVEVLEKEEIVCTPPARLEVNGWGKTGLSKSCMILTGPFIAAKDGYIQVRGQYKEWRKVGIWNFYDKDGNVIETINYSEYD